MFMKDTKHMHQASDSFSRIFARSLDVSHADFLKKLQTVNVESLHWIGSGLMDLSDDDVSDFLGYSSKG